MHKIIYILIFEMLNSAWESVKFLGVFGVNPDFESAMVLANVRQQWYEKVQIEVLGPMD